MRTTDFESEEGKHHSAFESSLSAEDFRALSPKDFQEETERLRELGELISALRNFAKHFGPDELYQQARAIYMETAEGRAAIEQEAAQIALSGSVLKSHNEATSERQRETATSRRPRNESRKLEEARRALGG